MQSMEKFVIDTNFFINLEIKSGFGKTAEEVLVSFTKMGDMLKKKKRAEFFMPPRVVDELAGFFEKKELIRAFLSIVSVKSPHISDIDFPAHVFYQLVEEMRARSYRGLRIAEEGVVLAGKKTTGREFAKKQEFEQAIGEVTKGLRERYRQATRFNFLDSVADLDLIVLSRELDAFLVSSDEGVLRWGRIFGEKELSLTFFKDRLAALLS